MQRPLLPQLRNLLIFIHPSHLSKSSIAPADVNCAATADASKGSIAGAEEEEEDSLSSPAAFFSSLFRLRNGEADRRAAPVEEDEGAERRNDCYAAPAIRSFFRYCTTSSGCPNGDTNTTFSFVSEWLTSRKNLLFSCYLKG